MLGLPSVWLLREGLAGQITGLLIMGRPCCAMPPSRRRHCRRCSRPWCGTPGWPGVQPGGLDLLAGTSPTIIEAAVTTTDNLTGWVTLVAAGVIGLVTVYSPAGAAARRCRGPAAVIHRRGTDESRTSRSARRRMSGTWAVEQGAEKEKAAEKEPDAPSGAAGRGGAHAAAVLGEAQTKGRATAGRPRPVVVRTRARALRWRAPAARPPTSIVGVPDSRAWESSGISGLVSG
ncbi:hypothetical protein HBB16_02245 [Pseudonocardia sp. MCCB 268]|nr:hypothetical protein [Pseudonocardia cytotoxica]